MTNILIPLLITMLIGFQIGNLAGDQLTFRDCTVKGEAKMLGGGSITCSINKEIL